MLTINSFRKSYSGQLIIQIDQLNLEPGLYHIRGINGSGKSTLMKCIAGLLRFEGTITLGGRDIRKDPISYRRQVSYSMAEPAFPLHLNAYDIIRFTASAKGASTVQQNELIEQFGVEEYMKKPMITYSSGMLKKVTVLLAFLTADPKVILLDEPFITLSKEVVPMVIKLVEAYQTKYDTMFIIASHQETENQALSFDHTFHIHNHLLTSYNE